MISEARLLMTAMELLKVDHSLCSLIKHSKCPKARQYGLHHLPKTVTQCANRKSSLAVGTISKDSKRRLGNTILKPFFNLQLFVNLLQISIFLCIVLHEAKAGGTSVFAPIGEFQRLLFSSSHFLTATDIMNSQCVISSSRTIYSLID